jgi:hypothetical protein
MSFNLIAEGNVDLVAMSQMSGGYEAIEVFPITGDGLPDALGIALPLSRANESAIEELDELIRRLWANNSRVFDLYTGRAIENDSDLDDLRDLILPH